MKNKPILYLICNAHLDPVWLWEWEEGAAQALSTFRTAAKLCEEFDGFVFNHNEAILYKWIENYDPPLFKKIKNLIKNKKWHVMGGWYLQPDCNMPCGESLIRQISYGKNYFKKKFNVDPKTAVNLDPFGHTRGLVQILCKSGYHSYLFCRPDSEKLDLPGNDFIWVGFDGSKITAHRTPYHYNSQMGRAAHRINLWLKENKNKNVGLLLWGVGNHGGGPSRKDLIQIKKLEQKNKKWEIKHSIPESYFKDIENKKLPLFEEDLNPWAVGCYTTMNQVKQKHRKLENTYYLTEKMISHAFLNGLMDYPKQKLSEALEDLLFCEFHDILPGSSIPEVEEYALQRMDHGLEILSRLKNKAFFRLLSGQKKAEKGEFPILVYNPHPYSLDEIISCEFQPDEPNENPETYWIPELKDKDGRKITCQLEKESSNISNDHRKRVVFRARLDPTCMNRFNVSLKNGNPPKTKINGISSDLKLKSNKAELIINSKTGLVDGFQSSGIHFLKPGSFTLKIMDDDPDPWGMKVDSFANCIGEFSLMGPKQSASFSGTGRSSLPPIRIIEQGSVRTTVEALFYYHHSYACVRYKFPKKGKFLEIEIKLFWNEKDKMAKLSIPTCFKNGTCFSQVPCGLQKHSSSDKENVTQKWLGVRSKNKKYMLTLINEGIYGYDFISGELRTSLLRSPAYAAHPVNGKPLVPPDRFEDRIDQGRRTFRFWLDIGTCEDRLSSINRESINKNQSYSALCCFPSGEGRLPKQSIVIKDNSIQLMSLKKAEEKNWLIIRLFEPLGQKKKIKFDIPVIQREFELSLSPFEIKTLGIDLDSKEMFFTDLLEQKNASE
ncbi:MAG: glycoside hydrolase family 38 C-terminal domain-containing protein [Candidatus Aminicenantes bacterium]